MSNKETQIKLLSNEPCREDAFEGHSHQTIAFQIARIIKDDDQRHIIGIEGGWGSGKSNLIALVNKRLNGEEVYDEEYNHKNSTYPIFVYDAWGHQADFQRRAILEELTRDLTVGKKILEEKKWGSKLEGLLAKRRKTTTKEVPRLGIGLIVSIILTFMTPLVVFLVGLIPDDKWWLKALVSVAPYLLGLWYAVHDRRNSLKENGQKCSLSNILSELILVYKGQIKENETYTTISEKEPSSTEFKTWMDEVDNDLKSLGKTLVIVFDNMDRLPSQKVEGLWSSIHSFFSDKTYDRIKVLIPFDRRHVQQAFKGENNEEESYGNDFINKTFDVVFRVPPPIMSGWQQYMTDMWKKAFGVDSEPGISVVQIFDALCKNPTPRKIIAFINEVATVKMTMRDKIPYKYIALFIFGKEELDKDPVGQLLNPGFMGDVKFEYEKDPNTIKYLSALYYQLPVDQALDVVFTKEATDALNSGNAQRLKDIAEHVDLSSIMGNAILKVADVGNATKTLVGLDSLYGISNYGDLPSWLVQIWDALYQKCLSMDIAWDEIKEFHVPLYTHLYDDTLADNLIKGYLSVDDDKWDAKLFVETIDGLSVDSDVISLKLEQYRRKVTPKLFLELLKYTKENFEAYGVTFDLNELDDYLAGLEMTSVLSLEVVPFVGLDKEALPKYEARLKEWLGNYDGGDVDEIASLFDRLKEVSSKPLGFENFFADNSVYEAWIAIGDDSDNHFRYDLMAMRLARKNDFDASNQPFDFLNEEVYKDGDAEGLAKVIEYYICFGDLLLHSEYYKDYPLACAVVDLLINNKYGVKKANLMDCLAHFDQTVNDYGINGDVLLNRLCDWIRFVDFEKRKVDSLPSGLLETASVVDNKLSKAIHAACEEHYKAQTQDQWKDHVLGQDDTYRLWKIYHPQKYQANFDALKSVLKDYAYGTEVTQPDRGVVDEWLAICLEVKHPVKDLFNDLYSILKKDSNINKSKLLFFGKYLLDYVDAAKRKDYVQKLIPTEIIDEEIVEFVAEHIVQLKECVIPEEFRDKVKHLAQTSMKDDDRIVAICSQLGLEIEEDDNGE